MANQQSGQVIRLKQLKKLIGLSQASIWRRSKHDPNFPKPFSIGPNATAWDEAEVFEWLDHCKSNRSKEACNEDS